MRRHKILNKQKHIGLDKKTSHNLSLKNIPSNKTKNPKKYKHSSQTIPFNKIGLKTSRLKN
jgi:hypothetical protein